LLLRDVPEDSLQADDFSIRPVKRGFDDPGDSLSCPKVMFLGDFVGLAGLQDPLVVPGVFSASSLGRNRIRFAEDVLQLAVIMSAVLLVAKVNRPSRSFRKHFAASSPPANGKGIPSSAVPAPFDGVA